MCGLLQGGGRRGLGKPVVAYRGVSFPVENVPRLSECQRASVALVVEMLWRAGLQGLLSLFVGMSGRTCFIFKPRREQGSSVYFQ